MKSFSQFKQRVNGRFKQRLVPFFNGVYGTLAKLRRAVGNPIVISNASNEPLVGLRLFGKSTQDGTPTPDTPVEIVSVENPKVNVDSQTISIPYTLHGIPVISGGNYTDANGQQWICDEVDFGRGVHIRRITRLELPVSAMNNSDEFPGWRNITMLPIRDYPNQNTLLGNITNLMCNSVYYRKIGVNTINDNAIIFIQNSELTQSEWKSEHSDLMFEILYVAPKSIETPLTADQIAAYKALHTNEPNTTIYNDKDAWMEVNYISK